AACHAGSSCSHLDARRDYFKRARPPTEATLSHADLCSRPENYGRLSRPSSSPSQTLMLLACILSRFSSAQRGTLVGVLAAINTTDRIVRFHLGGRSKLKPGRPMLQHISVQPPPTGSRVKVYFTRDSLTVEDATGRVSWAECVPLSDVVFEAEIVPLPD